MSLSLSLRRASPDVVESLSGDDASMFMFGMSPHEASSSNEVIQFFAPWHIVHFLSSGTEWDSELPAGFILGGQNWIQSHPEQEPAKLLTASAVKAVHSHLSALSDQTITERLSLLADGNTRIYGGPVPAEARGMALEFYRMIKDFVRLAAEDDQVIVKSVD